MQQQREGCDNLLCEMGWDNFLAVPVHVESGRLFRVLKVTRFGKFAARDQWFLTFSLKRLPEVIVLCFKPP